MEDYLKAIYYLQWNSNRARVRTSELAAHLNVTSPTVSSMYTNLSERGLIEHKKYKGAVLTTEGEQIALNVLRNYWLIEAYLTTEFDYQLNEVGDEADVLEHHLSDRLANALTETLGRPDRTLHGESVPRPSLESSALHRSDFLARAAKNRSSTPEQ
ncbi:metal-dependent transcriptional regulator [Natrialba magadii]|nr:metal-dependent transcriptional regulator [Natrialba magadii]